MTGLTKKRALLFVALAAAAALATGCVTDPAAAQTQGGATNQVVIDGQNPQNISSAIQLLLLVTVLSLAPAILVMVTSFTRIIVVLSLVRNAIGIPQLP